MIYALMKMITVNNGLRLASVRGTRSLWWALQIITGRVEGVVTYVDSSKIKVAPIFIFMDNALRI